MDSDKVSNAIDACPENEENAEVGLEGCSIEEFCGRIEINSNKDYKTCTDADWRDDDKNPKDCVVVRKKGEVYCTNRKN